MDLFSIEKTNVTGNPAILNDSAKMALQGLTVYGRSNQTKTTGAQLLDLNNMPLMTNTGATVSRLDDGGFIINGTPAKQYEQYICVPIKLDAGTYYISGGENKNGGVYAQIAINKAGSTIDWAYNRSFTVDGTETSLVFIMQTGSYTSNIDNYRIYPMLNKGTTALPWEPYTGAKVSPSLEYPQEITNAKPELYFTGKNLIDYIDIEWERKGWHGWYKNENRLLTVCAKHGWSNLVFESPVQGKQVTLSVTYRQIDTNDPETNVDCAFSIMSNNDNTYPVGDQIFYKISSPSTEFKRVSATFTSQKYIGFFMNVSTEGITAGLYRTIEIKDIQLELGSSATPYKSYPPPQSLTLNLNNGLPGIPVSSDGNYTDDTGQQWICDEVDLERGVYVQRVYSVIVDGVNVTFSQAGQYCNMNLRKLPSAKTFSGMSQMAEARSTFTSEPWNFNPEMGFLYLIKENYAETINESCKEHSGEVMYALETPIETPLTDSDIATYNSIRTYDGTTVVRATDDVGLSVTYGRKINMANTTLKTRIILNNKTTDEWAQAATFVGLKGEFLVDSSTRKIKIGDGATAYPDLPFVNLTPEEVDSLIKAASHSHSNKDVLDATTASFTTALLEKLNGIATGANKTVVDDYYGANNDATNGNLVPSTYNVWQIKCVADLRYSTNCTTTQFTANAPIYLECTLSSDRYFQVTTNCITQTFTKGKYYIYLGNTYSTSYQLCLTSQHPVYYYDGTNLVDYVYSLLDNKSDVGHTHNYAGSSSAGGVANSATKLATTRNISANDDYIMNFNFDGSGNVSTQLRAYNAIIAVANVNNYPYHRFAKLDTLTDSYQDRVTNLLITQDFNGGGWGICRIVLRTNNQSNTLSSASVDWLVRCGLAADSVQIGLYTKDGSTYADAFFKTVGTYWSTTIRNLGSGSRGNIGRTWTFINSSETNNTTTTDKKTSYEVYVSLADAGTALHNQAYTSTITGVDVGTVKYANTSGSATSATKDSANQQINTTYIKGLSANGKTITYTKGDNKTGTATISGFVPMEGTTKDNPMTGAIIQSSTDNGHTYLAGYTPSGSRLISSSSSGTRTTELTPSSFTTNLETGDAETSGALDVTFYPQKNKQMIYLGGSSSDWIIRGVGTPTESGDAVNKNYIDSTLENLSNDFVEELQGLIPVYGTWEDTPVTGNIVFNGKATVTGVKEPSSDSDVATKGYVDRQNSIKSVTLTAAGWTGTAAPYTQTVKVDGITEDDNPVMVSMLAAGATPDTQKAYNKAFGIICSGTGTTANGSVTFSVYSKPATDITVGLKGV